MRVSRGYDISAIDVGRGLAIASVMYGHALAPWFMEAGANFSEAAFLQWKFGASFIMPFFFFLSGLGWRETESFATTTRKALTLLAIAWLASAAFDLARLAFTIAGVLPPPLALDIVGFLRGLARMALLADHYSFSALWFLGALAVVRVLAAVLVRIEPRAAWAIGAGVLVLTLISTQYAWRNVWQIHLLGVALSFFVAGFALRAQLAVLQRTPLAAFGLAVIAGLVTLATFNLNQGCRWDPMQSCGGAWLNGGFGVSMIGGQFGNLLLFALTSVAGVSFAASFSLVLARFGGAATRALQGWGRRSLDLLVVNCLFLHVVNLGVAVWLVPRVAADNALFFVTLLTVTIAANLILVTALARPLRRLTGAAGVLARGLTAALGAVSRRGVAPPRDRVSQAHD